MLVFRAQQLWFSSALEGRTPVTMPESGLDLLPDQRAARFFQSARVLEISFNGLSTRASPCDLAAWCFRSSIWMI